MIGEAFLWVQGGRWFWVSLAACILLSLLYLVDSPIGGPHGSTIFGYGTGILAALCMGFLMLFSWRKRAYASAFGNLREWLSAHVWLGLSLLILIPLHAGFSFDWNVHSLAGLFALLTVLSGVWGVVLYVRLPVDIAAHRGGGSIAQLVKQCQTLSAEVEGLGVGHSDAFMALKSACDVVLPEKIGGVLAWRPVENAALAEKLAQIPAEEEADGQRLLELTARKREFVRQLVNDVRSLAYLRGWLGCHIPLAIVASATLIVHIWLVLFYP